MQKIEFNFRKVFQKSNRIKLNIKFQEETFSILA